MSDKTENGVRMLANALRKPAKKKPAAAEGLGIVKRVEGDTLWVQLAGSDIETPIIRTVDALPGDQILVRRSKGRAWAIGNSTDPPTSDRTAKAAYAVADEANLKALEAYDTASNAEQEANRAKAAADEAEASAVTANYAANSALTQAAIVEDVAGTLKWIQEHGSYILSSDQTVQSGTIYFQYNTTTQDYEPIVNPDSEANPQQEGWYVLDVSDSQSEFIMAHLAVTTRGLWVLPSGLTTSTVTPDSSIDKNSNDDTAAEIQQNAKARLSDDYKVLLSNNGMYVYDGNGALVTTFGENITFSANRPQYIGNDNAYISFNPTNSTITIGGNVIMGSNQTLDEVLGIVDNTFIYDHNYEIVNGAYVFTAYLYRGGEDVKTKKDPTEFVWYYKTEDSQQKIPLANNVVDGTNVNYGYTITISDSTNITIEDFGYGGHVIGSYSPRNDSALLTEDDDNLTDDNDVNYTGRTQSGDSVRVSDLTVSTVIFPSEKIMIVGSEDEHLVTIQTLQDYLNLNLEKQVLFNTTAAWNSQVQLQSQANTLYIYTDHIVDGNDVIAGIKVGDGNAYLVDLPFTDKVIMDHINNTSIHVTENEKLFWNNKVSCYYGSGETVIFTTS